MQQILYLYGQSFLISGIKSQLKNNTMTKKLLLGFCALVMFGITSFAQTTATGKVVDEKGAAISGATVLEKGTKNGTTTSSDGSYSLKVKSGAKLVVKAIGYDDQELAAAGNSKVALVEDTKSLSEVVVTGVGAATTKRKVAIDVATVSNKDFAKSGTASIEQSIMGQVAGAQIQQTSGQPNSGYNIILRGVNALGSTDPLILLDGVQVTSLSDIDPAIVDRVEVVKGAAGGMLYGAAGGNGVIQVFSKKGQKGKTAIRVSTKFNWDNVIRQNPLVASNHHYNTDAQGYILDNSGTTRVAPNAVGAWPDPVEDLTTNSQNNKAYKEPTFDHISQAYRQALTNTTTLSISGGSEKADYAFTASYLKQQDIYSNEYKRLNLNMNLGLELFKGFTFRSGTQVFISEDNLLTNPNSRFGMLNQFAYIDLTWRDSTGHYVMKPRNENQHNPLSEQEWHQNTAKPININQNFGFVYKFPKFVTLDYKLGITSTTTNTFDYYLNQTSSLQTNLPWGNSINGSITKGNKKRTYTNSLFSAFINTDFQKDFNSKLPIKTSTQLAYDYRKDDYAEFFATGSGLPTYPPYNINVASTSSATDYSSTFVTYGALVTQSIDYANLFGVSGGLRSDYSSEFGTNGTPQTFYRAAGYFHPSELIKSNILADWKVRFAYGEAGIQPLRYQRQVTLSTAQLGASSSIYLPTEFENPALRVQVSKELEIGTDVVIRRSNAAWFSKILVSGTYWKRKSVDVIQSGDLASSTGYPTKADNLTTLASKGFDLNLDFTVLEKKDITWNFDYRMGFAKTTVDKIANGLPVIAGSFTLNQGQDLGQLYAQYAIRDINALQPNGTPYITSANQHLYAYVGGVVTNTTTNKPLISAANDLKNLGSVYPKFTAAFINRFTIKQRWEVSFQFDWYSGNKIYNQTRQWLYRDRISKDFDNAVTIGNQTGAFVNYYNGFYNTVSPIDWFVEDGSFVRLRNLSVSYSIPTKKLKYVKDAQVTISGRNLFTETKYKGLDPENTTSVDSQGNDISTKAGGFKGIDYFGVPNTRSFQIGLTVGF